MEGGEEGTSQPIGPGAESRYGSPASASASGSGGGTAEGEVEGTSQPMGPGADSKIESCGTGTGKGKGKGVAEMSRMRVDNVRRIIGLVYFILSMVLAEGLIGLV